MVQLLARRWSPEQISYELRHRFPGQPERHLVPETISGDLRARTRRVAP